MFTLFDQERETRLYHEELKRKAQEEGWAEGHERGLKQGLEQGLEQGREEGVAESVFQLARNQNLTTAQAMDALGVSDELREKIASLVASIGEGANR